MSEHWWRSWHGAPTDPKWLSVARRAEVKPGVVVAIAWALFDYASQAKDRGNIEGFDKESLADFFGWNESDVARVIEVMADKRMIVDGKLSAWDKRQPKRERPEDVSRERVAAFRERQHHVTPCNATKRLEESRVDKKERKSGADAPGVSEEEPFFENFWAAYPRKIAKGAARKAFHQANARALADDIIAGAKRYAADKSRDPKFTKHPATWLNSDCWLDELPSTQTNGGGYPCWTAVAYDYKQRYGPDAFRRYTEDVAAKENEANHG